MSAVTRIARSIIAVITILCWGSGVSAYALVSEIDPAANLSDDRWERRDPFFPLIDFPQEITSESASVVGVAATTEQEEPYRYHSEGRRDPFRSILDVEQSSVRTGAPLTPLEQFEPHQLRLVGIIWNSAGYHALLETPDGMAYTARLGTAIGVSGTVSSVSEDHLVVQQSVRDVFGENKFQEVALNLYPDEEAVTFSAASTPLENQNTTQDDHDDEDE
ncbi:MAG TPA: hypothetical protein EYO39_00935 [Nitrospirales bacterium]|nr:hypothetical protein [Nitrospirales bacterium]